MSQSKKINVSVCWFACLMVWVHGAASQAEEALVLESVGIAPQGSMIQSGSLIVRCLVKNNSEMVQEGFLVARVAGDFASEDRCHVRIDPRRIETVEFPVRVSANNSESKLEVEVSLAAVRDGREILLMDGDQPALRRVTAWRPQKRSVVTALAMGMEPLPGPEWRWERAQIFGTLECAFASRIDAELSNDCVLFESRPLPIHVSDWQGIDNLIVAEPRYLRDGATMSAIHSFLARGGRVWAMLDAIDCELIAPLLEAHQEVRHVDTIDLWRCQVQVANVSISEADRSSEFEVPIAWKRVQHRGGTVTHSIDGWPVVLVMPIGRGELVLTTMDCEGMIERRKSQMSADPIYQSEYELRKWAKNLSEIVHEQRAAPLLKMAELSYPVDRIGNPVVSRILVTSTLFIFCGVLIAMGLWRCFAGEIPRLGFWYPAIAVVASAPLVIGGLLQKKDIPQTVSQFQWAQFDNPVGGTLRESNAVYLDAPTDMELQSNQNGFAIPDAKIQSGIVTVIHDDFERWRLTNSAWPAGIWRYTTESAMPGKSMIARGNWTPKGLQLQLPDGLPSPISDPIMSFVAGTPVLGKRISDGEILIDGEFPAEGERWTLQSIVDDEQRRRTDIYRSLFEGGDRLRVQTRTLVGWTDLFPEGPTWNTRLERRGAALVAMPVALQNGVVGDEVFVPYPLVTVRNVIESNSTPIFMDSVGRWVSQSSNASSSQLEFLLPQEIVPLRATSIEFSWDVEAPRRIVRLSLIDPNHPAPIELISLDSPSLPWTSLRDEPALLAAASTGKLVLKIEVSDDRELGGSLPWRIRHLRVSVRGTILPKSRWSGSSPESSPIP